MPERNLDELLNTIHRLDPDEVQAARRNVDLTLDEMVEAFYQGSCVVEDFYQKVLIPFQIISPSQREEVAYGLVLRIASSLKSVVAMNDSAHLQTAMGAARTVFELMVSLAALSGEEGEARAERLVAFTEIERYRSAQEIDGFDAELRERGLLGATTTQEQATAKERLESRRRTVDRMKKRHFAKRPGKKVGQWEWAGTYRLDNLVKSLGGVSEHFYRLHYPKLSWYAHGSSLVAIDRLDADAFRRMFLIAHDIARECGVAGAIFYAKIVGLQKVRQFREMVENVRRAPGSAMILSELEHYRKQQDQGPELSG